MLPYNSLFPANVSVFTAIAAILPKNTRTDILWAFRVHDRSGDGVGAAHLRIDLLPPSTLFYNEPFQFGFRRLGVQMANLMLYTTAYLTVVLSFTCKRAALILQNYAMFCYYCR